MVGKIYISGLIGTFGEEVGVELVDVISQVRKQPEATSFNVYINSEGGVVDVGFDIYNYLKSLGLPITTIGSGMVASIATVIFMAGSKRLVTPHTDFMIHLPMGGIEYATADEMESHSKSLRDTENKIVQFYSKELALNKEAITPLLKNETWLNEKQLNSLGFITNEVPLQITARAIINKSKKEKMSKSSKLQTLLKALIGETVGKIVYSADEKEINFPDLGEDDTIVVGSKATFEGTPAEGEIVSRDGTKYVFKDGIVESITEKEADVDEEVDNEEMFDALLATLEVAAQLESRVEGLETETVAVRKERDEFKTKLATATATIAKLKGSSKTPEADKKDKDDKKETLSETIAQWKSNKNKKK